MEIKQFDDWVIWEGAAEGGGRSEKEWLQSADGQIGLFKYPKSKNTSEFVSDINGACPQCGQLKLKKPVN